MRKISFVSFVALALTGCGITPVHYDGKSATYQHHDLDFQVAMKQAREMCAKDGKGIKHDRTDCGRTMNCVSTFLCVDK